MKRIRAIALLACSALLPLLGLNATPTFTIQGGTLTAVELHGDSEIIIPDGVTGILDYAFRNCATLTSLIIPASVTGIGGAAFYGCGNLAHITFIGDKLPLGSENLGYIARNCVIESNGHYNGTYYDSSSDVRWTINDGWLTGVELNGETRITLPSVVTSIGNAFQGCWELKSVTIPSGVTTIVNAAFDGCRNLESIEFKGSAPACNSLFYDVPDGCEVIVPRNSTGWGVGEGELWRGLVLRYASNVEWIINDFGDLQGVNLNGEKDIRVPNGVARIMPHVFCGCNELTSVAMPSSVTSIESDAFADCHNLTNVTIGSGVERIYPYAFYNCDRLMSVTIRGGTTRIRIEDNAFDRCTTLTNITVGVGVTRIADFGFQGSLGLTGVTIADSVTEIGYSAFDGCRGLTNVTIGGGVTQIGGYAFLNCSGLTDMTIPVGVDRMEAGAFAGCSCLTNIMVDADNANYMSVDGFLLSKDGRTLVASTSGDLDAIPENVTEIGANAFAGRTDLTSAIIPNSVTRIGASAFSGCSNLTNIVIPASVAYIGDKAFLGCNGLADEDGFVIVRTVLYDYFGDGGDITITDSMTKIGANAFDNCGSLTNVTISESVTSIGESAFTGCGKLALALLPMHLSESVSKNNQFKNCASNFKMVFYEGSLDDVEWVAVVFDSNGGVGGTASMDILKGQSLKTIGNLPTPSRTYYRFLGWYTDVTGGEPVTGDMVVNGNITLYAHWKAPETIYTIEGAMLRVLDGALLQATFCTSEVTIPESVTSIGDSAFYGQQELTSVIIPDSVTSIGGRAFYNCINLASVAIGKGVTNIGSYAFSGCNSVTNAIVPQYVCDVELGSVFPSAYASITNLVIADGVTSIARYAFWTCYGVSSITIPNSVTNIDRYAFPYWDNLSLALVPSRLKDIVSQNNPFLFSNPEIVYYDDAEWVDVTFDANGGYVAPSVANALKGHVRGYGIGNFPSVSRPGYDFMGWFTRAEGGEQITSETIVEGNTTLYAHWVKQPVFLWVYAMVDWGSRNAVEVIDGDTGNSSMAFLVPQKADGSFTTNIVFRVKGGYELDTVSTNGAKVVEASGKKDVWTLNIDLQDCNSYTFEVYASARLENYGVVAEKAICERTDNGYSLTAKDGETLVEGDIALTAVLDGTVVDTTKGYDVVIAADGKSATARLKTPTFGAAALVAGDNPPEADSSDPTGTLVESDGVTLSTQPWTNNDEEICALPVAAVPGLYYQAAWGDSLNNLTTGAKVQATTDTLYLGVIKQTGTSGFYKVTVSEQ